MKNLQKFFKTSGKYMVAASFALKPSSSGNELTIMMDLLKSDSQR